MAALKKSILKTFQTSCYVAAEGAKNKHSYRANDVEVDNIAVIFRVFGAFNIFNVIYDFFDLFFFLFRFFCVITFSHVVPGHFVLLFLVMGS